MITIRASEHYTVSGKPTGHVLVQHITSDEAERRYYDDPDGSKKVEFTVNLLRGCGYRKIDVVEEPDNPTYTVSLRDGVGMRWFSDERSAMDYAHSTSQSYRYERWYVDHSGFRLASYFQGRFRKEPAGQVLR